MKTINLLYIVIILSLSGLLMTGCWTDIDQYSEFVCERFGGDADGDGVCSRADCNDYNADVYPGAPCDDGADSTANDIWTVDCECIGN